MPAVHVVDPPPWIVRFVGGTRKRSADESWIRLNVNTKNPPLSLAVVTPQQASDPAAAPPSSATGGGDAGGAKPIPGKNPTSASAARCVQFFGYFFVYCGEVTDTLGCFASSPRTASPHLFRDRFSDQTCQRTAFVVAAVCDKASYYCYVNVRVTRATFSNAQSRGVRCESSSFFVLWFVKKHISIFVTCCFNAAWCVSSYL